MKFFTHHIRHFSLAFLLGCLVLLSACGTDPNTGPTSIGGDNNPLQPSSTPTPTAVATKAPSGSSVDGPASKYITDLKMAKAVDSETAEPKPGTVTTTFKTYTTVYATFKLNLKGLNLETEKAYINAKFYSGSTSLGGSDEPLTLSDETVPGGYFSAQYYKATDNAAVEIYWCRQKDCSDAKLAQVAYFTVTK